LPLPLPPPSLPPGAAPHRPQALAGPRHRRADQQRRPVAEVSGRGGGGAAEGGGPQVAEGRRWGLEARPGSSAPVCGTHTRCWIEPRLAAPACLRPPCSATLETHSDASLFDGNTASWVEMVSTNLLGSCMVQVRPAGRAGPHSSRLQSPESLAAGPAPAPLPPAPPQTPQTPTFCPTPLPHPHPQRLPQTPTFCPTPLPHPPPTARGGARHEAPRRVGAHHQHGRPLRPPHPRWRRGRGVLRGHQVRRARGDRRPAAGGAARRGARLFIWGAQGVATTAGAGPGAAACWLCPSAYKPRRSPSRPASPRLAPPRPAPPAPARRAPRACRCACRASPRALWTPSFSRSAPLATRPPRAPRRRRSAPSTPPTWRTRCCGCCLRRPTWRSTTVRPGPGWAGRLIFWAVSGRFVGRAHWHTTEAAARRH
jgi:hypothetical protein